MTTNNLFHLAFYAGSLVLCITALIFTFAQQRTDKLQNKLYIVTVSLVALNAVCQIISEMGQPFKTTSDAYYLSTQICDYLYFALHTAVCPVFCLYVASVCGGRDDMPIVKNLLYSSPFVLTELLVLTNPLTGLIYTYDSSRTFVREKLEVLIYVAAAFYFALSVFMLLFTWNALTAKRKVALIYFFLLVIAGVVIQLIYMNVRTELFAEALALLGAMTAIESEDDRMDSDSGIYNRKALQMDISSYLVNRRHLNIICLKVTNADIAERAKGADNSDTLSVCIADFLKTLCPRYYIYRTNPGTFMITVMDPNDAASAALAIEIVDRFDKPWVIGETELMLSCVVLTADVPGKISSASDALYMADSPVPNGLDKKILSGKDLDFLMRRAAVESAVNRGLEEGNFEVYYQPTFSLADLKLHGAEALIRLHDGVLGNLFPDEFIPIAEQIGMIDAIDDFVIREVCSFIKSGIPKKYGIESININLSVIECMQLDFIKHINLITEEYDIDKSSINFEITESIAANDYDTLSNVVAALKADGFRFSMDDYGTGYSNIRSIFMLDFDVVKIDKSILWSAEESELGKIILENSVRMIKQMRREILVEGVETKQQLEMLNKLSVDYLQGYFFSKPIPKSEFIELISKQADKENQPGVKEQAAAT